MNTPARRVPLAWVELGIVLALLAALSVASRVDPDYWWHLRTGDLIRSSGIPRNDSYSWSAAGEPWVAHEWLSELIISITQSAFGYLGNVILFDATGIGAIVVACALAHRLGASPRLMLGLGSLAAISLALSLTPRPQVFTWLLFSVFLYVLTRHETRDGRALLLLPPLMLLWANLHLGFFFGMALVGLWFCSRVLRRLRGADAHVTSSVAVLLACSVATFATASGIDVAFYPLRYLDDREALSFIAEWKSPLFFRPVFVPYYVAAILTVIAIISPRRPAPFVCLSAALMLAASLTAARNIPFTVLTLIPLAARTFQRDRPAREAPGIRVPLAAAIIGGFAILAFLGALSVAGWASAWRPSSERYPAGGAAFIEANYSDSRPFNEYAWGGYLIYKTRVPVFVDGRTDFYRAELLSDYIDVVMVDPEWQSILDAYGIDVALIHKKSRLADELRKNPEWREAFTGEVESVFIRDQSLLPVP